MNINEIYVCPTCGKVGAVVDVVPLMSDTRFDTLQCRECGCTWRMYYKVAEVRAEVVREGMIAPTDVEDSPLTEIEEEATTAATDECVGEPDTEACEEKSN